MALENIIYHIHVISLMVEIFLYVLQNFPYCYYYYYYYYYYHYLFFQSAVFLLNLFIFIYYIYQIRKRLYIQTY